MQNHVKQIIFYWSWVPKEMPLYHLHVILHISFSLGISFSATTTEKALQSRTSLKGRTKLSAMITGTHS
ncbi:uncharacterized protein LOC133284071 [Gastrolobium bilobum]|uniref:uncharacterized protein LOC133284071 n=1 Tax=Gastrolobium bilobum TaxID=150636 RepID=UPI002AB0E407|nr:uncharacterized protein LOC133284071 [Gastrolobium bilobum]